jgi:hypothetical protein
MSLRLLHVVGLLNSLHMGDEFVSAVLMLQCVAHDLQSSWCCCCFAAVILAVTLAAEQMCVLAS